MVPKGGSHMELRKFVEKNQPCKERLHESLRILARIIARRVKQLGETELDDGSETTEDHEAS